MKKAAAAVVMMRVPMAVVAMVVVCRFNKKKIT